MSSQTMDTLMDFAARKGCPDSTMIEHLCAFLDQSYDGLNNLTIFLNQKLIQKGLDPLPSLSYRVRQLLDEYAIQTRESEQQLFESLCDYCDQTINATDLAEFLEESVWC